MEVILAVLAKIAGWTDVATGALALLTALLLVIAGDSARKASKWLMLGIALIAIGDSWLGWW